MATDTDIESNIKFLGWVKHEEIPQILRESMIGIGPLRNTDVTKNALPIKVLEYMAASLPLISKKETLPENILVDGENGFFISDSTELVEKIVKLLENHEMIEKFGENSRKIVEKFDWKNIAQMIIDEYSELRFLKNK
jgi:glycosyltransferase involved in cell wall biosynthesis